MRQQGGKGKVLVFLGACPSVGLASVRDSACKKVGKSASLVQSRHSQFWARDARVSGGGRCDLLGHSPQDNGPSSYLKSLTLHSLCYWMAESLQSYARFVNGFKIVST